MMDEKAQKYRGAHQGVSTKSNILWSNPRNSEFFLHLV